MKTRTPPAPRERPSCVAPFIAAVAVTTVFFGCSDDRERPEQSAGGAFSSGSSGSGTQPDSCGSRVVDQDGAINAKEYQAQARRWDRETIDCRLGPSLQDFPDEAAKPRPSAWEATHTPNPSGYLCKQIELSGACASGCDYGSTAGQVLYAPDDKDSAGVDRVQTYAYENGTICESPQMGPWLGGPSPDPGIEKWNAEIGERLPLPNGFHQTDLYQTNGGILIFPNSVIGATGNQTAGGTFPWIRLPENKVPTAVAVTGYNEFALVTVWDTEEIKGQIAVIALRSVEPKAFSIPYFALPNEGGFVGMHLMGYVDLPDMATPTAIAALGNNGRTPGGHAIGNEFANADDPSQNIASSESRRTDFARDDHERWVPSSGHAVVLSRWENKATFIDLQPLFAFVRQAYFSSQASFDKSAASDWPYTFENEPSSAPEVVTTLEVTSPTVVRVGNLDSPFAEGLALGLHAFIANEAGDVDVFEMGSMRLGEPRPVKASSIKKETSLRGGRNITSMRSVGDANRSLVVVSRRDAVVQFIELQAEGLVITREMRDERFLDPVVVDVNDRGPVVTIGDFFSGRLLNFRYAPTEDNGNKPPANFGCGPNGEDAKCEDLEFGGSLDVPGAVFYVGTTNVN
jgi:hypothetical protein